VTCTNRPFSRLAVLAALCAALALGACGRKGPLDAPPGAAVTSQPAESGQQGQQQNSGNNLISRGGASGLPVVRGEDKRIPLDVLLN